VRKKLSGIMADLSSEFAQWIKNNGVELNCDVKRTPTTGNGLYFDANKTTNPLVKVPNDMVMTGKGVLEMAESRPFLSKMLRKDDAGRDIPQDQPIRLPPRKLLARFLVYQMLSIRRGTPDDKFAAWIRCLPPSRDIHLPFTWMDEELDSLAASSIYDAVLAKRGAMKLTYMDLFSNEKFREEIAEYVKSGPRQLRNQIDAEVTFHDWQLVEEWILSRSLSIPQKAPEGEVYEEVALVPVVDLCNHGAHPTARYDVDEYGNVFLILCEEKMSPGQEITITYGPDKGSGEFLFNYGFIPEDHLTAKEMTRFYDMMDIELRQVLDPEHEPASKSKSELDISYELLAAFLDRPQNRFLVSTTPSPAWHDDFIYMLACEETLSLVRDQDSGYYELHFRGSELDLNQIEGTLRARDKDYFERTVQERGNVIARSLIKHLLEQMDDDVEEGQKLKGSHRPKRHHHRLVQLERLLLEDVLEHTESSVASPMEL
jgi:hypothetical protein